MERTHHTLDSKGVEGEDMPTLMDFVACLKSADPWYPWSNEQTDGQNRSSCDSGVTGMHHRVLTRKRSGFKGSDAHHACSGI